jgi:RecB family endonuclease NucS
VLQPLLVRMLVVNCSVTYEGRLGARLAPAPRLVLIKADGSLAIHSDSKAYKPLNWMNPPCVFRETPTEIVVTNQKGETIRIDIHEVISDTITDLGTDPGLEKDGVEAELQELIAARVEALQHDIGPVDLLCRDGDGNAVVVEIKRVGEIAGVEQLIRYQERLDRDSRFAPTRGMFAATRIKPQARVFAESRGIVCVEFDVDELRGGHAAALKLF